MPTFISASDYGAVAQVITAIAAIFVAWFAYRFARQQTAINVIANINTAWNDLNKFGIENDQARSAFAALVRPISDEGATMDTIIYMHLNIQEMYYMLRKSHVIRKSHYKALINDSAALFANVPRENMVSYLSHGYAAEFTSALLAAIPETPLGSVPVSTPPAARAE